MTLCNFQMKQNNKKNNEKGLLRTNNNRDKTWKNLEKSSGKYRKRKRRKESLFV